MIEQLLKALAADDHGLQITMTHDLVTIDTGYHPFLRVSSTNLQDAAYKLGKALLAPTSGLPQDSEVRNKLRVYDMRVLL